MMPFNSFKVITNEKEVLKSLKQTGKNVTATTAVGKAARHLVKALKQSAPVGQSRGGTKLKDSFGVSKQKARKTGLVLTKVGSLLSLGKWRILHILEFGRKSGKGKKPFMRQTFANERDTMLKIFTDEFKRKINFVIKKYRNK
jgi:HK97 gp10 family phage protein